MHTYVEAVGDCEEEADEIGEEVVIRRSIVVVPASCHEGDRPEEVKAREEGEEERLRVENARNLGYVLTYSVSNVVHQVENYDFPDVVYVGEVFCEGGTWVESEGEDESEHDDERIRHDLSCGFVESPKVVLSFDPGLLGEVLGRRRIALLCLSFCVLGINTSSSFVVERPVIRFIMFEVKLRFDACFVFVPVEEKVVYFVFVDF